MQEVIVTKDYEGQRLNKFLGKYLDAAPQSFIYKMLRKKNIKLNNGKATGNELLQTGDLIKIFMTDETIMKFRKDGTIPVFVGSKEQTGEMTEVSEIKKNVTEDNFVKSSLQSLDIIYENEDVLILNKPIGILSQKAQKDDYTLNEQIVDYYNQKKIEDTLFVPSVCNRLDRNTSGLILAGMSLKGSRSLSAMLKDRTLDKYYLTVVSGRVPEKKLVKGYLSKHENHNQVRIYESKEQAEKAMENKISYIETLYEPIAYGLLQDREFTLLKVKLITGKTHQIRAHLHSVGFPIVGDGKYGDKKTNQIMKKEFKLKHQLLHAFCMEFPENVLDLDISLKNKKFVAPLPKISQRLVDSLFDITLDLL